jgi:hypothetical protein
MRCLVAILLTLLCACSPSKLVENALTPQERTTVQGAIDDLSRGDSASLAKKLPLELAPKIESAFGPMRQALPARPLELSLTNANWTTDGQTRSMKAVYQVKGASGWALVEASTVTAQGRTLLTGFYIQRTAGDPQQLNAFKLSSAGAGGLAMLAAMMAAVGITIAALIRIWRSGLFRHRWLWTIGALIGTTTLKMNWSTGAFDFQPISIQLFSASATKQPVFAPWVLGVSLPIIALIALFYRGGGRDIHPTAEAATVPED